MQYDYEKAVPYEYINLRKPDKVEFTNAIRQELDNYYRYIKKLDDCHYKKGEEIDTDSLINDLGEKYQRLREDYIIPYMGDKFKGKLSSQEYNFLFACSHELYCKFQVDQTTLNKIWNIDKNRLERADWYPQRSFMAYYHKCDRTMRPNGIKSKGALIAQFINQNIQARYMCCAFTGITNDLDLFANISFDKNKCFVLTSPMKFKDGDDVSVEKANYALARMLFASGNMLYDGDTYVAAGCIVRKISALLNMKLSLENDEILEIVQELLASGTDIAEYASYGKENEISEYIRKYQFYEETVDIYNQYAEVGYVPEGLEYFDEHFGVMENQDGVRVKEILKRIEKNKFVGHSYELVEKYADEAVKKIKELSVKIYECLDWRKLWNSEEDIFGVWISFLDKRVRNKFILTKAEEQLESDGDSEYSKAFEDKITAAASYWIAEAFKDRKISQKEAEDFLGSNKLYLFFDSLSYVNQKQENKSLYMMDESGDILKELRNTTKFKEEYKTTKRSQIIYIDTKAHSLTKQDIDEFIKIGKIILVVHDVSDSVAEFGLEKISDELKIYYMEIK